MKFNFSYRLLFIIILVWLVLRLLGAPAPTLAPALEALELVGHQGVLAIELIAAVAAGEGPK